VLFGHAIALMREHIRPTSRVHRVIRDGGSAPNIIADEYWARDVSGDREQTARADEEGGRLRRAGGRAARIVR